MLALLLLLTVFASCTTVSNSSDNKSTNGAANETGGASGDGTNPDTDEPYVLPERSFDGREFRILMPPGKIWQLEEHSVNPDQLNKAIYERNMEVEFAYHVAITPVYKGNSGSEYNQLIHQELNAQTGDYDVCYYPQSYGMIGYINQSRYFYNLLENEYINLNCDWWLKDWNSILTMNNKLYGISGYGVVESMSGATEVYFNKTLYNDLYPQSSYTELYTMVEEGKWTLGRMEEMAKAAKNDLDGDGVMEETDRYGVVSNTIAYVLLYAMGSEYIVPDENEGYVLNFNAEHNFDVFEKLYRFVNNSEKYYLHMTEWLAPNTVFGEGRALFQISAFDQAYRIKNTGVDYGILPLPKYDEQQTRYYTVNNATGCFTIFTTCDDLEFSSIMLNAWNYYSYQIIYPQYKESFYKYNIAGESEDSSMIDLIFESMTPEFAHAYSVSFSSAAGKIFGLILNKDSGYTSLYKTNQELWQSQLDTILGKKQAAPSPFD